MTLDELSQAFYLQKEIDVLETKLRELHGKAAPGAAPMEPPVRSGNTSKTESLAIRIAELTEIIDEKRRQRVKELEETTRWIMGIPDARTRLIFTLRFLNGLSWDEVALAIGKHVPTVTVKRACYSYLAKVQGENTRPDIQDKNTPT